MTDLQIEAGTLVANAAERTLSGRLVPFHEEGNTNLGRFTVAPGVLKLPRDPSVVTLNVDHSRENPVGRATDIHEEEDGIHATFRFADTEEGDTALAEYADGTRKNLSVEAKGIVLRAGAAIAGSIFGAALVGKGAFPSATLLAADAGDLPEAPAESAALEPDDNGDISIAATAVPETVTVTVADAVTTFTEQKEEEPAVALPNTLTAAATATPRPKSLAEVNALYAARASKAISEDEFIAGIGNENGSTLFAALSDIKYDGTGGVAPAMTSAPQWLGQVWQASVYKQQILPLFSHKDLTGLTFSGFKFGVKPSGGDWAGNKANVPSNTMTVSPVSGTASRYAIGHDIAREFVDFPVDGFFEAYAAAVSEDYARWVDGKVASAVLSGATALTGAALTTLPGGTNNIGSAASAIIDGAMAVYGTGTAPDFALVSIALYTQYVKNPTLNVSAFLSNALGLTGGELDGFTVRPSASIPAGKVLVGAKQAVTVFELPGAPIRIDALDLARGGVDKAAFGYAAVNVNDATALQLVTAATA